MGAPARPQDRPGEDLDQGRLIDLSPGRPGETLPLYALYPSRHLQAAKARGFIGFVATAIG